ncbi:hypothetical protein VTL71DRAFT_14096 [Oculimacula yallundae]|uniref:YDG domain-containing protein n=1 Tax=Oculimacula yallundae TaxID=86028 RepID=A0ABR4CI75_9HELO
MTSPKVKLEDDDILSRSPSSSPLPSLLTSPLSSVSAVDSLFHTWLGTTDIDILSMPALDESESELISLYYNTAKKVGILSKREQTVSNEQMTIIKTLLWRVSRIEVYDAGNKLNIKGILTMILTPMNKFEAPILEIAAALQERFESQNWGAPKPEPIKTSASGASRSKKNKDSKVKQLSGPSDNKGDVDAKSTDQKKIWALAPDGHPIFGLNGCMHHIALTDNSHYQIHGDRGDAAVFGHNGFEVGQCWPRLIAAVRDGVHGAHQQGIYGTADAGVYSLVIAEKYSELDYDKGELFLYSVSGALKTTSATPNLERYTTRALLKSIETKKPIRVLRTKDGGWINCPKEGRRYDGLYRAVGSTIQSNNKLGKFVQVELVRMEGQEDICKDRPKGKERRDFEKVTEGY